MEDKFPPRLFVDNFASRHTIVMADTFQEVGDVGYLSLTEHQHILQSLQAKLDEAEKKLTIAIKALERQKKSWHGHNGDDFGCLAECSITCEALAKLKDKPTTEEG